MEEPTVDEPEQRPAPDAQHQGDGTTLLQRVRLEVVGEIVLLLMVGAFFLSFYLESRGWPLGAALMPRIVIAIGTPLWFIRFVVVVRHLIGAKSAYKGVRREEDTGGQIMDLGFYLGDDQKQAIVRLIGAIGSVVALVGGVWMIGWHVGLPLWTVGYLLVFAKVRLWQALAGGAFFLAIIVGLYDLVFDSFWNDPVLLDLVR